MTQISRYAAAEAIADLINADDNQGARVWTKEDAVRVYLKLNRGGKKGWSDNGFINFAKNGQIEVSADRQASVPKDAVRAFLADHEVLPATRQTTEAQQATTPRAVDFDTFNMLRSGE